MPVVPWSRGTELIGPDAELLGCSVGRTGRLALARVTREAVHLRGLARWRTGSRGSASCRFRRTAAGRPAIGDQASTASRSNRARGVGIDRRVGDMGAMSNQRSPCICQRAGSKRKARLPGNSRMPSMCVAPSERGNSQPSRRVAVQRAGASVAPAPDRFGSARSRGQAQAGVVQVVEERLLAVAVACRQQFPRASSSIAKAHMPWASFRPARPRRASSSSSTSLSPSVDSMAPCAVRPGRSARKL